MINFTVVNHFETRIESEVRLYNESCKMAVLANVVLPNVALRAQPTDKASQAMQIFIGGKTRFLYKSKEWTGRTVFVIIYIT